MNANRPGGGAGAVRRLPSELSLWFAAVQGTMRHRRRRREVVVIRRGEASEADRAVSRSARHRRSAGRGRTVAMMSGLVLGSAVPAWALVATINTPQVYSNQPAGPSLQAKDPQPDPKHDGVPTAQTPSGGGAMAMLAAGPVSALTPAGVAATSAPKVAVPHAQSTWYSWTPPSGTYPPVTTSTSSRGGGLATRPAGQPSGTPSRTEPGGPTPTETAGGMGSDNGPSAPSETHTHAPTGEPSPGETQPQTPTGDPAPPEGTQSSTPSEGGADATPTRTYEAGQPGTSGSAPGATDAPSDADSGGPSSPASP